MTISDDVRALFRRLRDEPRRIVFPFRLPGRNELDAAARTSPFHYNVLKKAAQRDVVLFANRYARAWAPPTGHLLVACNWREPDARRDPSNIVDGGRKILLDGIARGRGGDKGWSGAGLIHCDGRHCLAGFIDIVTKSDDGAHAIELVIAPLQLELPLSRRAREVVIDAR